MGIKRLHEHEDGLICYGIQAPAVPFRYTSILSDPGLVQMASKTFAVARWSYTGHWLAFDTTTGKKIEDFSDKFYQDYIKPYRVGDLESAPECDPAQTLAANTA